MSANLACSGAKTSTSGTGSGEDFKPGIDFYVSRFTPTAQATQTTAVKDALLQVATAMTNAGYTSGQYKIVGSCVRASNGLSGNGEPDMALVP